MMRNRSTPVIRIFANPATRVAVPLSMKSGFPRRRRTRTLGARHRGHTGQDSSSASSAVDMSSTSSPLSKGCDKTARVHLSHDHVPRRSCSATVCSRKQTSFPSSPATAQVHQPFEGEPLVNFLSVVV